MLRARWKELDFKFRFPAGTSRGVLYQKKSWFLLVTDSDEEGITGIGELSIIPGLSPDDAEAIPSALTFLCASINQSAAWTDAFGHAFPSMRLALETALLDLHLGGRRLLFDTPFSRGEEGIPVNGLVWMGTYEEMKERIVKKISEGFEVIKLKVGAIDFEHELELLRKIRKDYSAELLEIRLDANGAFTPHNAIQKLEQLAKFHIHSIEQPISPKQFEAMARICKQSPIPVALDEELIGIESRFDKKQLLEEIKPAFIILKPSLIGGMKASDEWVNIAEALKIGWWATSALESNIGLNAIAQWTASKKVSIPQGLGTGQLYERNFESPLGVDKGILYHQQQVKWSLDTLL